jgi:hypothetical protein
MVSVPFKQLTIINCLTNYLKKELTGLPEKYKSNALRNHYSTRVSQTKTQAL